MFSSMSFHWLSKKAPKAPGSGPFGSINPHHNVNTDIHFKEFKYNFKLKKTQKLVLIKVKKIGTHSCDIELLSLLMVGSW
jgi:hypothetical protein